MEQRIRVLIADDQVHIRQGLQALLAAWPEINVVGAGASGVDVAELVEKCRPAVVLLDLPVPQLTFSEHKGLEVIRLIKNRWPHVRLVVLTMFPMHRAAALAAGADAFLLKGCTAEALRDALLQPGPAAKERATLPAEICRPQPWAR